MEKQPTRISDIPSELLQSIIIHLAKSSKGAEDLARTITVCKHFRKIGEDEVVLRVANFNNVELSDVGVGFFQINNSLIKRCAQLGNISAQYLLAKVIISNFPEVRIDGLDNYFEVSGSGIGGPHLADLSTRSISSGKLYHYELVRLFLKQCNILDFASTFHRLIVYFYSFSSNKVGRHSFFRRMDDMSLILGVFTNAGLQEGPWSYDPETKLLPTEFETEVIGRLRNRILVPNFEVEHIERDCKEMAELSIVSTHGKGNEEGSVLNLGERFFQYLVSKYFDDNVKLLDPNVLLSNNSFKEMKELCVELAKEWEMHRSNALKLFDESFFPS